MDPVTVGIVSGIGTIVATLVGIVHHKLRNRRHAMNLDFYRDMASAHGVEGLEAASRATHPNVAAAKRVQRRRAARKSRKLRQVGSSTSRDAPPESHDPAA